MITFINKDLFSTVCEKKEGKDGRPDYFRTIINSSMNVVNKRNPDSNAPRVIEHVLHTSEDMNKDNTQIGVKLVNDRSFIRLNQKASNKYDSPVFFIAIPYNGFVVPVERSRNFQIYKAITVSIDDPIEIGDDTFKHVAYIMLVPNRKVLEDEKTPCEFVMESFSTRNDDDSQKTIKSTCTIEFYLRNDECDYEITTKQEETDPVNIDDYAGKSKFPITIPKKKYNKNHSENEKTSRPRENKQKDNKAKTPVDHLTHRIPSKSLEEMISDADLDSGRPKSKRGKKSKGKKKRR